MALCPHHGTRTNHLRRSWGKTAGHDVGPATYERIHKTRTLLLARNTLVGHRRVGPSTNAHRVPYMPRADIHTPHTPASANETENRYEPDNTDEPARQGKSSQMTCCTTIQQVLIVGRTWRPYEDLTTLVKRALTEYNCCPFSSRSSTNYTSELLSLFV